ncbi:NADAR family protein [Nocardiopsis salina]|uniref:NADAR family protein n=1 Tax=Nocardiopsis salina TaxID=245836 RepID=UPI0004776952|nr:NADAR family protein [Nocardiopsis salina]
MSPTTPADARSVDDLLSLSADAPAAEYLFFRGHRKSPTGVSASCLSQWWEAPFTVDGKTYRTAEHYMMAGKARLFGDAESERRILAAKHPADAKALGRGVAGFAQGTWDAARYGIVVEGSVAKFAHHPELSEFLLGTGSRVLVEASPGDRVWGIGMAEDDPDVGDPRCWRGLNLLGFALMAARARLR